MNLGNFSIKNKYLILSLAIAILIFGMYSKMTIKTQMSPDTASPMATVIVQYPGAAATEVVKDLVEPMEDEFGKLEGILKIKSTAQDNRAIIELEFDYGTDIDEGAIDIQNSINRIKGLLPYTISEPKIMKASSSNKPIMTISINSDSIGLDEVRQLAEDKISYMFQSTEGVASIDIFGGYKAQVQIQVDKSKLDSFDISLEEISNVLNSNNIQAPGGEINDKGKDILIRIDQDYESIESLERIPINLKDGNYVFLEDIADISLSIEELQSTYNLNGQKSIALMIIKKNDANTVETVENIKETLSETEDKFPNLVFEIARDESLFTSQMVDNMTSSVMVAILLTIVIIILFIPELSKSFVVAISMPLVFLTTIGFMKLLDMKLDMVTLSALILSIGIVVDDSIVVVENIIRHVEEYNKNIVTATIDAVREISLSTWAGTTTTLIVLVPLLFMEGFVGEMFKPLSTTLIIALISSVTLSLTVIPLFMVLFSRLKFDRIEKFIGGFTSVFRKGMEKILVFYVFLLNKAMKRKALTYIIVMFLLIASGRILLSRGVEMLPKLDNGITYISIEMDSGTTLKDTKATLASIEEILQGEENIISFDTQIGFEEDSNILSDFGVFATNQALITVDLNTRKERSETIWEFQEKIREEIEKIPNIQRFVVKEQGATASASSQAPIDIKISGPDQEVLYYFAKLLSDQVEDIEGVTNIYRSFNMDNLQLNVKMKSERIQELGLTSAEVSSQILNAVEGIEKTSMDIGEFENVEIHVGYMDKAKQSTDDLLDIQINTVKGIKVPLRDLVSVDTVTRANVITKEDLDYTIDILAYDQGRAFSKIIEDVKQVTDDFLLPEEYSIEITGDQKALEDSMGDMISLMAMAVVFIYLLLVPQFKSFIHPVTIMAAIPLIVIGVSPSLILAGKYVSMPVVLGLILLSGTVVNNSILLIDKIIMNRKNEMDMEEAVIYAVKSRFRAIMMTAFSDIAGMLPLALQLALGSERFSPLAITVIGGILSATFMTMIIIPLLYISFDSVTEKVKSIFLSKSIESSK